MGVSIRFIGSLRRHVAFGQFGSLKVDVSVQDIGSLILWLAHRICFYHQEWLARLQCFYRRCWLTLPSVQRNLDLIRQRANLGRLDNMRMAKL